jgi:hypothetical protein
MTVPVDEAPLIAEHVQVVEYEWAASTVVALMAPVLTPLVVTFETVPGVNNRSG